MKKIGPLLFWDIYHIYSRNPSRGDRTCPLVMADGIDDPPFSPVMTASLALPPAAAVLASGTALPPILLPPPLPLADNQHRMMPDPVLAIYREQSGKSHF